MAKRIILTVLGLLLIIGALAGTKASQFQAMGAAASSMKPPPAVVSTDKVRKETWQPTLSAVGTVTPVRGVTLHSEAVGMVKHIYFESGANVKAGDVLVQLDTLTEQAALRSAQAQAELGQSQYKRVQSLEGSAAIAQSEVDRAGAETKRADAEVTRLQSEISKRTLRAPFAGTLGIWQINLGKFLNVGDPVNWIVALERMYVDFTLPQQRLAELAIGQVVRVTSDAFPGESVEGQLTAIDPALDAATRAVRLRATLDNPKSLLRSGMFVRAEVVLPKQREVLIIPSTAIIYAPYGDSVYVIETKGEESTARQQFVRLGEARGDYVEVTQGLEEGDPVVTVGAFKLRNGMGVAINNELAPKTSTDPTPENK